MMHSPFFYRLTKFNRFRHPRPAVYLGSAMIATDITVFAAFWTINVASALFYTQKFIFYTTTRFAYKFDAVLPSTFRTIFHFAKKSLFDEIFSTIFEVLMLIKIACFIHDLIVPYTSNKSQ